MNKDNYRGMKDWDIFIQTAQAGSINKAAGRLNLTPAAVSKAISRLERYLATLLFTRSPKGMFLTETGNIAFSHALKMTDSFESLISEVRNKSNDIKGNLRFSAPAIVCELLANQWSYDYVRQHPDTRIFLNARERSDLTEYSPELDDLVLRSGRIESLGLVHRKLSPLKLVLCASPDYLKNHPQITHPRNLDNHFLFGMHNHGLEGSITLSREDEDFTLNKLTLSNLFSNNLLSMLNLAVQGKGIGVAIPEWIAQGFIGRGEFVVILPEWKIPDLPVWLIWRQRQHYSRLFTDFRRHIEECWENRPRINPQQ